MTAPPSPPPMRLVEVRLRADGHDAVGIDRVMAVVVVARDMVEMHALAHARPLVERAQVGPEVGVIHDPGAVAFEMSVIDQIKPDERGEKPPVGLGQALAHQVAVL